MTAPLFQVSLQRLLVAVALFAVLFGLGVAFVGSDSYWLPLGIMLLTYSICVPSGSVVWGRDGAVFGFVVACLVMPWAICFGPWVILWFFR